MVYTTIIHPIRKRLGVTPFDYMLLDIIAKSQGNERYSVDGWCKLSYIKIANWIGVSDKGIRKSSAKVQEMGLLEVDGSKKRVTQLWFGVFDEFDNREQSTAKKGNKVPQNEKTEQSTDRNKVPHEQEQSTASKRNKVPLNQEQSTALNIKSKSKYNSNRIFVPESENQGSEKGAQNLVEKVDNPLNQEVTPKKKKVARKKKKETKAAVLFSDTEYYDNYDLFSERFEFSEYCDADLKYYWECVKNWADSKGEKRKDWVAVARQFMLRDRRDGKLVLNSKNQNTGQNGNYSGTKNGQAGNSIVDVEQARRIAGLTD